MRTAIRSMMLIVVALLVVAGSAQADYVYNLATNAGAYSYGSGMGSVGNVPGPYLPGTDFTVTAGYAGITATGGLRLADNGSSGLTGLTGVVGPYTVAHSTTAGQTAIGMVVENHVATEATGKFVVASTYNAMVFGYQDPMNWYMVQALSTAPSSPWQQVKVWKISGGVATIAADGLAVFGAPIAAGDIIELNVSISGNAVTVTENRWAADGVTERTALMGKSFTYTDSAVSEISGKFGFTTNHNNGTTMDALSLSVVPEPATMALLAIGGLGVLARRRRR